MLNIKIKNNLILAVFFIMAVVLGFGAVKVESASAWDCVCAGKNLTDPGTIIRVKCNDTGWWPTQDCRDVCSKDCKDKGFTGGVISVTGAPPGAKMEGANDVCQGLGITTASVSTLFNCLLLHVLNFLTWILQAAASLFIAIIDPKNLTDVISNKIIYEIWTLVRDTLNVAFILTLLFSAFATIFQVDKFSYKKILLTLVIMALLVNFSFPIARVIIDFSNVIMYYFLNGLEFKLQNKTGISSLFSNIADFGRLKDILHPKAGIYADTSYLVASVIFVFILGVTFLTIAILFVIRTIALGVLMIFSPLAFVGSIVPFLSSHASKWWTNLFNYSFFGPIMVFMIYVSVRMMDSISVAGASIDSIASTTSGDPSVVAAISFFAIPIVILWIGIGTAQSMSIAGAGAVVGRANKFMNWAGMKFSGLDWGNRRLKAYQTERKKRADERFKDNWGQRLGRSINRTQDRIHGALPIPGRARAQRRLENLHNADVREHMQRINDITNEDELANLFDQAGSEAEREAILRRAAAIGGTSTILNRAGQTNDIDGFTTFMQNNFGNTDRSARLASTISGLESARHNTQFSGVSSYVGNQYQYNQGTPGGANRIDDAVFAAVAGEHQQNMFRNLRAGQIVTRGAGGNIVGMNNQFEAVLQRVGDDALFGQYITPAAGNNNYQLNQVPQAVVDQLTQAVNAGHLPPAGSRTEAFFEALRAQGRI
ncbi:MAG: hypothetical protein QG620_161 [Patescibacteria group bacterium]|nr:hypothetical protein [Patescibacteria group bacterium]